MNYKLQSSLKMFTVLTELVKIQTLKKKIRTKLSLKFMIGRFF